MNRLSNADQQEIAKFDRVSRMWWDDAGPMRMLHVINPLRSAFILGQIEPPRPKILDVGCGGGILAEALARSGASVTAIDLSQPTLEAARRHAAAHGLEIDYRDMSVEQIAQEAQSGFDAVTCMEMLEHVPDPREVIAACAGLLKPGGRAFFSTIDRSLKAFLFAILAGEYVLRLLPRGTHQYRRLIRPQELRDWARSSGLEFAAIASLLYNPLTRRFRMAPDRADINYMACFVKKG
jgi:2-polyprenyl-6-hydroxyphenyl methylase/3-demethylubiquinone-9 3-methyltransferase